MGIGNDTMIDSEFLNWIADRVSGVYKENETVDFVQKLRRMAQSDMYKNTET